MNRTWICRDFSFHWGEKTLLMGVLNITPDSFSDGGLFFDHSRAIKHAYEMIEQGAHIIDVGGESSRPGADPVPEDDECQRVIPVINELAKNGQIPVSIDTTKYSVAAHALDAGAAIINDISGLQAEPKLADLAASSRSGLIIMHMRGTPQTMQLLTHYTDLVNEMRLFFEHQIDYARQAGVQDEQIVLDPGIGFGKTAEQNLTIINQLRRIRINHFPLLAGVSRKSFIGKVTRKTVDNRLMGTAAAVSACLLKGCDLIRVHDVAEMMDVASVIDALLAEARQNPDEGGQ